MFNDVFLEHGLILIEARNRILAGHTFGQRGGALDIDRECQSDSRNRNTSSCLKSKAHNVNWPASALARHRTGPPRRRRWIPLMETIQVPRRPPADAFLSQATIHPRSDSRRGGAMEAKSLPSDRGMLVHRRPAYRSVVRSNRCCALRRQKLRQTVWFEF